jgi:hypothetical protein
MHSTSASLDQLQARLRRLHASLASTSTLEIPVFQSPRLVGAGTFSVEFTDGRSAAEMENVLATLVANVASLKDHLKEWCVTQSIASPGDRLIDSDLSVALVHDLWNRDKHPEFDTKSRFEPISRCRSHLNQAHRSRFCNFL